jgi:hypothetical protein
VGGANEPDAQGADDRPTSGADRDAVATVGSEELSLEDALRQAALEHLAKAWGFESWRAYATFDLDMASKGAVVESRNVWDLVSSAMCGAQPVVEEQLGILETENDDLRVELNDVRQMLAELGVPVNPVISLRRHIKRVILDLRARNEGNES